MKSLAYRRTCSLLLLSIILGLLFSLALASLVNAKLSESSEHLGAGELLSDLKRGLSDLGLADSNDVLADVLDLGLSRLELVSGRVSDVTLLGLVGSSREEDKLASVAFKSLHIQLETFLRGVLSSVVNSNADGSGEQGADLGLGELLKGETLSVS